jgi:hypothetical protein
VGNVQFTNHLFDCPNCREAVRLLKNASVKETIEQARILKMSWEKIEKDIAEKLADHDYLELVYRKCFLMWETSPEAAMRILDQFTFAREYFGRFDAMELRDFILGLKNTKAIGAVPKKTGKGGA